MLVLSYGRYLHNTSLIRIEGNRRQAIGNYERQIFYHLHGHIHFSIGDWPEIISSVEISSMRLIIQMVLEVNNLVFWNSIHLEVASNSFCLLINSSWLLVFILYVFFMIFSGFNLYCWKGIHFS